MRFDWRNNRFYFFIIKCSWFTRYSITGIFLLILCMSWWIVIYKPINIKLAWYKSTLNYLHAQKKSCLHAYGDCAVLEKNISQLSQEYTSKVQQTLTDEVHYALTGVIDCLSYNSIKLASCTPEKVSVKKYYTRVPFKFVFKSNFKNIIEYFKCLSHSKSFIVCDKAIIKKSTQGMIECTCTLSFLITTH